MFGPTRYIQWAQQFYGQIPFDLATSGIPYAKVSAEGVDLDDLSASKRLRESIAHYNDVPVADVMPALGTSQGLFYAYASTLAPGDEVLVEAPGYEPLARAAEGIGAVARFYERRADEGFRVLPDRVAAAVTPRTRMIVVTNLHNPSGVRTDDATLLELAKIAEARGAYLLVDEVYAAFDDLPEDGVFRRSARKLAPNVIAVSSLTKCYGLGMHRVGWLLGPKEVVEAAEAATISTTGHLPLAHAALGVAAFEQLRGPKGLAARAKGLLAGKRAVAEQWAAHVPNSTWSAPNEGLFGLLTLHGRDDLRPLLERAAKEHGVLAGAGGFFGVPNALRLSWATLPADKFEQGLALLAKAIA